jgi:hypothetical protein
MKRKGFAILAIACVLSVLVAVYVVNARRLTAEMDLYKPPTGPEHSEWGTLSWSGTISGEINGNIYFYNSGRIVVGDVKHFWEVWFITDDTGDMLLLGTDKGVVSLDNMQFRMNGEVIDAAPQYEHLIGRNVHMSGTVISLGSGAKQAPGEFQVN